MTNARTTYRENVVRGASPLGLVVMLYEQLVEDLRRASAALDAGEIEQRTNAINHATLIIGQLQGRLNHEAGGKVAMNLDRFYNVIRESLMRAQILQSKTLLAEVISALLEVRGAWQEAERTQRGLGAEPVEAPPEMNAAQKATTRLDWKA